MSGKAIKATLGKNIKFFRFRWGYSQALLAEKAGISITFLSNIERGVKFPKPDILFRIAGALETEVHELFKAELIAKDNKELIHNLEEDIEKNVNAALKEVFRQYLR